jgi:hypothetical protein
LYDISERLPGVSYHAFTRHEEAKFTGADWEWWILFSVFSIRLRVQAKKLAPGRDHYPELARTNRHGLQIEKFLNDSKQANAIPLYVFYSPSGSRPVSRANAHRDGVFVADGQLVYDTFVAGPRKPVVASDILRLSRPLPCILCLPVDSGRSVDTVIPFPLNLLQGDFARAASETNSTRGLYKHIPPHILSHMQAGSSEAINRWEKEFEGLLQDHVALLIHDFRNLTEVAFASHRQAS